MEKEGERITRAPDALEYASKWGKESLQSFFGLEPSRYGKMDRAYCDTLLHSSQIFLVPPGKWPIKWRVCVCVPALFPYLQLTSWHLSFSDDSNVWHYI